MENFHIMNYTAQEFQPYICHLYIHIFFILSHFWVLISLLQQIDFGITMYLSSISLIIFFKILKVFDEQKSYIISILYFVFPLNFYASSQISSVSIQVFCFIFYLFFFKSKNFMIIFF